MRQPFGILPQTFWTHSVQQQQNQQLHVSQQLIAQPLMLPAPIQYHHPQQILPPAPMQYHHPQQIMPPAPMQYQHPQQMTPPAPMQYQHPQHIPPAHMRYQQPQNIPPAPMQYQQPQNIPPAPMQYQHQHPQHIAPAPMQYQHPQHIAPAPMQYQHPQQMMPTDSMHNQQPQHIAPAPMQYQQPQHMSHAPMQHGVLQQHHQQPTFMSPSAFQQVTQESLDASQHTQLKPSMKQQQELDTFTDKIKQSTNPAESGYGGINSKSDIFNQYNNTYAPNSRGPNSCQEERHEEGSTGILSSSPIEIAMPSLLNRHGRIPDLSPISETDNFNSVSATATTGCGLQTPSIEVRSSLLYSALTKDSDISQSLENATVTEGINVESQPASSPAPQQQPKRVYGRQRVDRPTTTHLRLEVDQQETKRPTTPAAEVNSPAAQQPKRVRIFAGGFMSTEEYTYVRGRGKGRYVCEECGIRCKKPGILKKHIRTHTDLRPYTCRQCNFSFKTKGNLTKHMKSKAHHKKCTELGIVPVPTTVDEANIDQYILAQQKLLKQVDYSSGDSDFNDDLDDDEDDEEADEGLELDEQSLNNIGGTSTPLSNSIASEHVSK